MFGLHGALQITYQSLLNLIELIQLLLMHSLFNQMFVADLLIRPLNRLQVGVFVVLLFERTTSPLLIHVAHIMLLIR